MKTQWLITFRSVTFAQKAQNRLRRAGIDSTIQRTPTGLSERGCSYCLTLRAWDVSEAAQLLRDNDLAFGKSFRKREDGRWEEQVL